MSRDRINTRKTRDRHEIIIHYFQRAGNLSRICTSLALAGPALGREILLFLLHTLVNQHVIMEEVLFIYLVVQQSVLETL